jgi:hypothetical protein
MRQPPSLADRVLAALPGFEQAPLARDMAARLNTDEPHVRQAFERLESEGRAKIVRRGRGLHLMPADYPGKICPVCRVEYVLPPKSKRITCSRSCGIKWSWKQPGTAERRYQAMVAARRTPEARARTVEINNKRWARAGEREKLSEQNRKRWADPYQNAKQAVAIQRVNATPEKRELQRQRIKARWDDPAGREKLVGGIRKSKSTPEARAKFSKLLKERWEDPVMRAKYTAGNKERNRHRAEQAKQKQEGNS